MKILKAGGEEFTGNLGGKLVQNAYCALDGADALVLMTAHREFRELDLPEGEGGHAHGDYY